MSICCCNAKNRCCCHDYEASDDDSDYEHRWRKIDRLNRLEKLRDANIQLKQLINKVDKLDKEIEVDYAKSGCHCSRRHRSVSRSKSHCCEDNNTRVIKYLDNNCFECEKIYYCCENKHSNCCESHHDEQCYVRPSRSRERKIDKNVYPSDKYQTAYEKHCQKCDYCEVRQRKRSCSRNKYSSSSIESYPNDYKEPWRSGPYVSSYQWRNEKIREMQSS